MGATALPSAAAIDQGTRDYANLMTALDAVDAVRARTEALESEADRPARQAALRKQLQDIYAKQGIAVPDGVVETALAALDNERFAHAPATPSLMTWLASLYVTRAAWGPKARRFGMACAACCVMAVGVVAGGRALHRHSLAQARQALIQHVAEAEADAGRATGVLKSMQEVDSVPSGSPVKPALDSLMASAGALAQPATALAERLRGLHLSMGSDGGVASQAETLLHGVQPATPAIDRIAARMGWWTQHAEAIGAAMAGTGFPAGHPQALAALQGRMQQAVVVADERGASQALDDMQAFGSVAVAVDAAKVPGGMQPQAAATLTAVLGEARAALGNGQVKDAQATLARFNTLAAVAATPVSLRIVDRPGERSGVWRYPNDNPGVRNYYLIVDAIGPDGRPVEMPVTSVETQGSTMTSHFAVGVPEAVYDKIKAEKTARGSISDDVLGHKPAGALAIDYTQPVQGGLITEW